MCHFVISTVCCSSFSIHIHTGSHWSNVSRDEKQTNPAHQSHRSSTMPLDHDTSPRFNKCCVYCCDLQIQQPSNPCRNNNVYCSPNLYFIVFHSAYNLMQNIMHHNFLSFYQYLFILIYFLCSIYD